MQAGDRGVAQGGEVDGPVAGASGVTVLVEEGVAESSGVTRRVSVLGSSARARPRGEVRGQACEEVGRLAGPSWGRCRALLAFDVPKYADRQPKAPLPIRTTGHKPRPGDQLCNGPELGMVK